MPVTSLHVLLAYRCPLECAHCFVWSSPRAPGVLSLGRLEELLRQASEVPTITAVEFEGGEPFLYYPLLVEAVRAAATGCETAVVTNAYWATGAAEALAALAPLAGAGLTRLVVSRDRLHDNLPEAARALEAAARLGLAAETLTVVATPHKQPGAGSAGGVTSGTPGVWPVLYRGRAAARLAAQAPQRSWQSFDACTAERLADPARVHVDPYGYVQVCQGIAIGNVFETPLATILRQYEPRRHPVVGPLLNAGPAGLAEAFGFVPAHTYADACHLCYTARAALRRRLPAHLVPAQVYGQRMPAV